MTDRMQAQQGSQRAPIALPRQQSLPAPHQPQILTCLPHMHPGSRPLTAPPQHPPMAPIRSACSQAVHSHTAALLAAGVPHPLYVPAAAPPAAGFPPWPWQPWQVPMQHPPGSQPHAAAHWHLQGAPEGFSDQHKCPSVQAQTAQQQPGLQSHRKASSAINFTSQRAAEPVGSPDRPKGDHAQAADALDEAIQSAHNAEHADQTQQHPGEAGCCLLKPLPCCTSIIVCGPA